LQVPESYLEPYAHLKGQRRTLAGMLAAMDEAVGQVVSAVEAKGVRARTLFIFSSDNGGFAPGRVTDNGTLRAGKGTLYEGGVRAAAFAAWDGRIPAGRRVKEPLHMVDWYPTLLKLAGAPTEQKLPLDGRDAWPTITAGKPSPHEEILLNTAPNGGALRWGDWKLVLSGRGAQATVELFDLSQDPSEKNNLAAQRPEKVQQLRARYDRLAAQALPPRSSERAP
jgi:arylsulfatase A-like enzyme